MKIKLVYAGFFIFLIINFISFIINIYLALAQKHLTLF